MKPGHNVRTKRVVHRTMPCQTRHIGKYGGRDDHIEVAFAPFLKACVTTMAFAVIDNFKMGRGKCRLQLCADFMRQ